jgi:hypothetical protein
MHALTILHRCLGPLLTGIHARRLATLLEAVPATVCGPRLTLTNIDWWDLKADQWLHLLRALFVLVLIASLAAIVLWLMGRRQSARGCTSGCVGAVVNVAVTPAYSWRRSC